MRIQRWVSYLSWAIIVVVLVLFLYPKVQAWVPRPWDRWAAVGLIIACISPLAFWEVLFPPVFDVTAKGDTVDYEFRDPAYAVEFANLNGRAARVPMNVFVAKAQAEVDAMIRKQCEDLGRIIGEDDQSRKHFRPASDDLE